MGKLPMIVLWVMICACSDSRAPDLSRADFGTSGADQDFEDASTDSTIRVFLGDSHFVFDGQEFWLAREELEHLRMRAESFEIGVVPEVDARDAYDPWYFAAGADDRGLPLWREPEGLTWVSGSSLSYDNGHLDIEFGDLGAGRIELNGKLNAMAMHWSAPPQANAVFFRLHLDVDEKEGFYGLGEYFDHVNHRGQNRAMQLEISHLESGYNEAHVPVPFLIGTTGWGVLVDSNHPGVFEVASRADDLVTITFGLGADWESGLRVKLITESHPLDVTNHYYMPVNRPTLPPPWALGPLLWRDEVSGQALVESDLRRIRELDLATTGYWIDRPYATDVNSFDFDSEAYPNPEGMMSVANELGFKMALWHAPYLSGSGSISGPLKDEAEALGFFPSPAGIALSDWGLPFDFSTLEARQWWASKLTYYQELGIEGYKLDYGEDIVAGLSSRRLPWEFGDGTNELTMHKRYAGLYHEAYRMALQPTRGLLLCRSASLGDQDLGVIIWPGDIDADFSRHGDVVNEGQPDEYIAVGGLPAAIVAGSGLGPSGFPFFAADTGGYRHAPPTKEVFIRWFQQSAFSPAMQVGTNSNDLPWEFGEQREFDQDLVDLYREFARIHLRLFPYIWTYANRLLEDGRPIQRPFGLVYPELGVHPDFIYLLGEDILVAPVIDSGVEEIAVQFGPGKWIHWFTGVTYEGPAVIDVPVTMEDIPVFIRDESLIPLLSPDIDTLAPSSAPGVRTLETSETLWVRVIPGTKELEVYDGSIIRTSQDADVLTLEFKPGSQFEDVVYLIEHDSEPSEVEGAAWRLVDGRLEVTPSGSDAVSVAF